MKKRIPFALLLAIAAISLALAGCRRNIVRAAPPSVAAPPQAEPLPPPIVTAQVPPRPPAEPPPNVTPSVAPVPSLQPAPQPAPRPRPPEVEAKPKVEPEPEPPPLQISPQLSARDQKIASDRTQADIVVAERNLQLAYGRQLNASQKDLVEKVSGFLGQAHEAVRASDWIRAENLAHKARVLSDELTKAL